MKKLKIGIIGVGRLGYEHACNIANRVPGSELVAIADANFDRAKQVAEELGVTAVYNDPKALCADPNVEAVAIITNTASHVETEIVGTEAHIRVAGVPWKDRVMVYDQYGARQEIVENFPQRFAEAYLLEMVDFIDCIQKDRKPELTVYDGTKATLVTYAITDSFHSGKPVQVQY